MDRLADPLALRTAVSRRIWLSRCASLFLMASLLVSLSGCQIVIGVLQIFQGFPKTKNDFAIKTRGRSLAEKGKRTIILVHATPGAQAEEPSLDLNIMDEVSRRLKVEKIEVVPSHKVAHWLDERGQIDLGTSIEPIARHFKADFVVLFSFDEFGYREDNSPSLYRGHSNGKIVVTEMVGENENSTKKIGKVIYNCPFTFRYPGNRPVSADQEGPDVFKRKYLGQLSNFLVRRFVDFRPEDEID
ncbi:MAG: hypothetical protein JSS02_24780 [Planctomycetes bacterium]|nr:hypothetical protein [Planctomycetota bacterium]